MSAWPTAADWFFGIGAAALYVLAMYVIAYVLSHLEQRRSVVAGIRGRGAQPVPFRSLSRAYLVVHLDLRQSPPVASFACIYSCSARDLTCIGCEARADVYKVEADTFEEALREMKRIQPLYFPWLTPLMTRGNRT